MFDSVILYLLLLHQLHSPTGHLILDTGKSGDHEVSHMMPMMGHHFNPYSFYPMQHHQSQPPMIHVHPVYIEDHSAMHHHAEPSHHHEYQHHEEKHYPEHHGMEYQHHEPHYQEMHHHQMHQEMHHQPEHQEEQHQQHQEPMGHHYEQEAHHEEGGGGHHGASMGYESNPMMQMMMHGSGPQPAYDQLAALQALQHQALYAGPHFQDPASQQYQQNLLQNLQEQKEQQTQSQQVSRPAQTQQQQQQQEAQQQPQQQQQSNKPISFFDQAGNNPLVAIIKPIFKRDPNKKKKP